MVIALAGREATAAPETLAAHQITLLALERVPRTTRAQAMDVLSSQATVAGYKAALIGASSLPRFLPMLTTAAGFAHAGQGAGAWRRRRRVAGDRDLAAPRRRGHRIRRTCRQPRKRCSSLGAKFLAPEAIAEDAATAGGYAKELADEQQQRVLAAIDGAIAAMDLVISTAAIPGKPAPRLITTAMVERMKPGSVIVDVAAETGGNCELTRPGETIEHHGVTMIGPLNLPSTHGAACVADVLAQCASRWLELLRKDGKLVLDHDG